MIKGVRTLKYGEIIPIIGEIYREGETGTLLLQNEQAAKYLYFQGGQVIFAASNAPEDKFTQILLEEGKLKEEQLDMAMEKKGNKTIAKTLTELGFISSPDLLDSLIMQVYRVAESVIRWTEGNASFKPDVLPQGVAKLPLSTQRLILDLSLSVDNRQWALQILGGMEKVVAINKAEMDVTLTLPLSAEEEKIARLCDGVRSIDGIASASGSDPFRTIKLLIGLHFLGLARPKTLVESVAENPAEVDHQEDKHLDFSFLEQALPSQEPKQAPEEPGAPQPAAVQFEPAEPSKEDRFVAQKIDSEPEPSPRQAAEPPKEETPDIVQPPLFQPTFLPLDNEEFGGGKGRSEPKLLLTPPNPMPKRSNRFLKPLAVIGSSVLIVGALAIWYFMFTQEDERNLPPPAAPPPAAKKQLPRAGLQVPPAPAREAAKEEPKTAKVEPPKPAPMAELPAPKAAVKEEAPKPVVQSPKEVSKTEEKKPATESPGKAETAAVTEATSGKDPYESLKTGDYTGAASGFKKNYSSKKGGYTIALMIACETETVQKSFAESGASRDFIIFPHNFKGRNCYRVMWGYYASRQDADAAFSKLPGLFKDSGARVVPFDSMRP